MPPRGRRAKRVGAGEDVPPGFLTTHSPSTHRAVPPAASPGPSSTTAGSGYLLK